MDKHNILDGLDEEVLRYYLGDLLEYIPETKVSETKKPFNISEYMKLLKKFINDNKLYTSQVKKICDCLDIDACDCEDDVYTDVNKTLFTINNLIINIKLSFANSLTIIKNGFNTKIFSFDKHDNEIQLMNIDNETKKIMLLFDGQELEYSCNIIEEHDSVIISFML